MHDSRRSPLSKERRQEVFLSLVQSQDGGANVRDSRDAAAREFGLSVEEVRQIEKEGLEAGWPPLG